MEQAEQALEKISRELSRVVSVYSSFFVGRERTIRLILLALVSKQHIYMVSPPGTGKTMMEAVARSFGFRTFYYLFSYDTKLEDILYNPVIRKEPLPDATGEKIIVDYELKDPGLGTVEIFFADEMFKAPSVVLNALLGAMSERRVTLGNKEYRIPLWTLVAASNELPENADALLDRFLYRDFLEYLPKERWTEYLIQYWNMHQPGFQRVQVQVPRRVIEEAHERMWQVDVFNILDEYVKLLDRLHESNIVVSDRRKGRILQAIAASAVLDGRDVAEPEDLEVLLYTVPTTPEELDTVKRVVDDYLGGLLKVKEELERIEAQLKDMLAALSGKPLQDIVAFANELPRIKSKLVSLEFNSLQRYQERINNLLAEVENQLVEVIARRLLEEV